MRYSDFQTMVHQVVTEVPPEFLDGIESIDVTAKTVPHPTRQDVYTLGECVPQVFGPEDTTRIRSSVLLHYGSFAALARLDPGFDWRHEAWETLTHELRHHLEWRANVPALEALDEAAEANYARHDGEPFAPLFFLDGERLGENVYKVEDDVFFDVVLGSAEWKRAAGATRSFTWHGRPYDVTLPAGIGDVLLLRLGGLRPEPAGEAVLVVRRRPGARDLLRPASVRQATATARPTPAPAP